MSRDAISAAWDGIGHSEHIGKRSLLRVGGLICMAQANQIEAMTTRNGSKDHEYYFAADEVIARGKALGEVLADGRYTIEELLLVRELLNELLAEGKATDPNWIKKPQRPDTADDAAYRLVLASRVAPALAGLALL